MFILLRQERVEVTHDNPGRVWVPLPQVCPKSSASNNSVIAINKSCSKRTVIHQATDGDMKTLDSKINKLHLNSRRFQKTKIRAVLDTATLDKNLQFLSRSLCMKDTAEEASLVSTRLQTSSLFFFMRLTTSCCLRGLLSPLTFQ